MNSSLFCALSYPKFNTLAIGGFTLPISGGFTLRNFGGAKLLITINAVNLLFIISSRHVLQPRGQALAYC